MVAFKRRSLSSARNLALQDRPRIPRQTASGAGAVFGFVHAVQQVLVQCMSLPCPSICGQPWPHRSTVCSLAPPAIGVRWQGVPGHVEWKYICQMPMYRKKRRAS